MNRNISKFLLFAGLCALLLPVSLMGAGMMNPADMGTTPAATMGKMPNKGMMMPAADGQALLDYITKTDPYAKWELMPGTTRMRQGKEPHATLQNVYVNAIAAKAFKDKPGSLPDGSIIVKESYTADKKLTIISAMFKKQGFNPMGGDYMWLRASADLKILAQGRVAPCIACHTAAQGNDYIMLAPLK